MSGQQCSLFNSIALLFMSSEKVREFSADNSILELAAGTSSEATLKEFFEFAKKQKSMKKPIMSPTNFPLNFKNPGDFANAENFFAKLMLSLKSLIISERLKEEQPEGDLPKMSDIASYMLTEGPSVLEDAEPTCYLVYLTKLLFLSFNQLWPQPPSNPEDPTEERSLGEMLEIMTEEANNEKFKKALDEHPLDSILAQELARNLYGDIEVHFTEDPMSPKLLSMFARVLDAELKKMTPEDMIKSKMVTAEVAGRYSLSVFNLTASLSIGISKFPQKFLMERTTLSSEFFIPNSTFYEMQKTKIIRSLKLLDAEIPDEIPEEKATPFDNPEYPVLKDMIVKLKGGVQYVTEDFDWKFLVYDFLAQTFITLFYSEKTSHIPQNLCDYGFFFGSRHLGWASTQTVNIVIVTDKRLRYLTQFQKNINLFVAPNENTPVEYLAEYIRQSINIDFTTGDPADEQVEILKHCFFMAKYTDTVKHKIAEMDTKLITIRELVNPNFDKSTNQVDLICYFKHPKNPKFVNYRTKERKTNTNGTVPVKVRVDSIKPDPSKTIAHIQRWALEPFITKVDDKPLVLSKPIPFFLPVFMLLDIRGGAQTLIESKSSITFSYFEWLAKDIVYGGISYKYRLKGFVCQREDGTYYPVAVKANLTDGKTFESGNPTDVQLENVIDTSIHFVYLERELPTV